MTEHRTRFRVEGMDCASCAGKIDTAVTRLAGVESVEVSVVSGTMTVRHAPGADLGALARVVADLGYDASRLDDAGAPEAPAPADRHRAPLGEGPWWASAKARLVLICGAALLAAFALGVLVPATEPWGFVAALAVGLVPIARRALAGARAGSPFSIETLMTVAAVGAVIIGATEEAAVVVLLFLVGEFLEGVATGRARAGIRALADLMPRAALLETPGGTQEVPADTLAPGDVVLVRPGDRIPADGTVLSGQSAVDEAPVTGESVPRRKQEGDTVFAGTVNHEGVLRVRVEADAADNTIARIVALVEQAQESKAPTERIIDRFARVYTPAIMVLAALVATLPPLVAGEPWDVWIYRGLALLLIGCPCALVISTPAAIAAALSAGARRGLLMKGGVVLEGLGRIDRAAFDKTGTLTQGRPTVTEVIGLDRPEAEVLALAAALEAGSNHPLARAVLARAEADNVPVRPASGSGALGGRGVFGTVDGIEAFLVSPRAAAERAELPADVRDRIAALNEAGNTVSVLLSGGAVAGLLALRDEPRPDAAAGIAALKSLGIDSVMLTGDNARTGDAIARSLGMEARSELLPEDKQKIVESLGARGHRVLKVGDGINDAPALAAADVGIAMGGGTDVALETADAAILNARVTDVAAMVALSRAARANIVQNIAASLGLKAIFLVTTVLGVTGLWPAILADTGATVLVTANAMRLLAWKSPFQAPI